MSAGSFSTRLIAKDLGRVELHRWQMMFYKYINGILSHSLLWCVAGLFR